MLAFLKLLLSLVFPTSLSLILLAIGLFLLWKEGRRPVRSGERRSRSWGFVLCLLAFLVLLFGSNPRIGRGSLAQLQHQYPTVTVPENPVEYVVVLGGGVSPRGTEAPALSELSQTSLSRLVEGIRLQRLSPGSILLLSGKGPAGKTEAGVMKKAAVSLGADPDRIELDERSMNTAEQAIHISETLGDKTFQLVTAGEHLPRAMAAFEAAGSSPQPAPAGMETFAEEVRFGNLFGLPNSRNLHACDRVLYERIAFARTQRQVRKANLDESDE